MNNNNRDAILKLLNEYKISVKEAISFGILENNNEVVDIKK